jgi:hypothetical protein
MGGCSEIMSRKHLSFVFFNGKEHSSSSMSPLQQSTITLVLTVACIVFCFRNACKCVIDTHFFLWCVQCSHPCVSWQSLFCNAGCTIDKSMMPLHGESCQAAGIRIKVTSQHV